MQTGFLNNMGHGKTGNLKLLLVEDNKLNQRLIESSLKRYGYEIDVANNGAEGVDMCKKNLYDAVLMDIMMPVMDGFEATIEIRKLESGKKLPIIAVTANVLNADREKCLSYGMNEFISKPFSIEKLKKAFKDLGIKG